VPSYDLVYVVRPDLEPDAVKAIIDRVGQRIADQGGKVDAADAWGKRRMSYVIRKQREGVYVHTRFTIDPRKVAEIRRQVALNEEVLRTILTKAVGKLPEPAAAAPTPTAAAPVTPAPIAAPPAPAPVAAPPTPAVPAGAAKPPEG
jgi:small subunit ribosomal protein S6